MAESMITVRCPVCRAAQRVPPGTRVRCYACSHVFPCAGGLQEDCPSSCAPESGGAAEAASGPADGGCAVATVYRRSRPTLLGATLVLVVAAVVLAVFILRSGGVVPWGIVVRRPAGSQPVDSSAGVRWSDATRVELRMNHLLVRVSSVERGEVRGKDASNRVIVSETDNYLLIYLRITNAGAADVLYRSWYGRAFDDQGTPRIAQLSDNTQRKYEMMVFSGVKSIKGHIREARLKPQERIEDVVVFALPEDLDRARIEYFRLELPAAACGGSGFGRFEIPSAMIQGFR